MPSFAWIPDVVGPTGGMIVYGVVMGLVGLGIFLKVRNWRKGKNDAAVKKEGQN